MGGLFSQGFLLFVFGSINIQAFIPFPERGRLPRAISTLPWPRVLFGLLLKIYLWRPLLIGGITNYGLLLLLSQLVEDVVLTMAVVYEKWSKGKL